MDIVSYVDYVAHDGGMSERAFGSVTTAIATMPDRVDCKSFAEILNLHVGMPGPAMVTVYSHIRENYPDKTPFWVLIETYLIQGMW